MDPSRFPLKVSGFVSVTICDSIVQGICSIVLYWNPKKNTQYSPRLVIVDNCDLNGVNYSGIFFITAIINYFPVTGEPVVVNSRDNCRYNHSKAHALCAINLSYMYPNDVYSYSLLYKCILTSACCDGPSLYSILESLPHPPLSLSLSLHVCKQGRQGFAQALGSSTMVTASI